MNTSSRAVAITGCLVSMVLLLTWGATSFSSHFQETLLQARAFPPFGIAGVEPDSLLSAIDTLQVTLAKITSLATTSKDRESLSALYPLKFLHEVARLEKQRRVFLKEPTLYHFFAYTYQLSLTKQTGTSDLHAFREKFLQSQKSSQETYIGYYGVMRSKQILELITHISDAFNRPGIKMPLRIPVPTMNHYVPSRAFTNKEILSKLLGASPKDKETIVALAKSACVVTEAAPYLFLSQNEPDGSNKIRFLNDIYFIDGTGTNSVLLKYYRTVMHLKYINTNPMNFYFCPMKASDSGSIAAIVKIKIFAETHPLVALSERSKLLGSTVVFEDDAINYLNTALSQVSLVEESKKSDPVTLRELYTLRRMYLEKNAGLVDLLTEISTILENDIRLSNSDLSIPMDFSPQRLFRSHSAFPSLFFTQNEMLVPAYQYIATDPKSMEVYARQIIRYRTLSNIEKLRAIDSLSKYLQLEGTLNLTETPQ